MAMWSDLKTVPRAALLASVAVVAPLLLGALILIFSTGSLHYTTYTYLIFYAPLSLVFVAATHGGLAIAAAGRTGGVVPGGPMAISVVLLVVAWLAILLPAPLMKFILLLLGFAASFATDMRMSRDGLAPPWFVSMRKATTLVVLLSLGLAALAIIDTLNAQGR